METTRKSDQFFTSKNINNFSADPPDQQVKGQSADLDPKSAFKYSTKPNPTKDNSPTENNIKSTITTTNNNIKSSKSSSSGNNVSTSSCKHSNCSHKKRNKNPSVLAKVVTKVVVTSSTSADEEHEAFLAEIDSDLPNFLTRTFMGQDARFSFILFFTVFSFSLVLGLFVIQASYAWHNYQLLEMLGREDFSEEFFYLHYYDPPEPLTDDTPSPPGLRVNTSFYVH